MAAVSLVIAALLAAIIPASAAAQDHVRPDVDRPIADGGGQVLAPRFDRELRVQPGEIGVESATAYLYEDDTIAIVGDVLNLMTTRRELAVVTVDFYNGDTFIGSLSEFVFLTRLAYGSTSPFLVYNDAPAGTTPGITEFEAYVGDPGAPITAPAGGALRVVPGPTMIVGDERHVTGTIENVSAFDVEFVFAAATTYDAAGDVVDVTYDLTTPDTIPAHDSATYDLVLFYDPTLPVARTAVTADGWQAGFEIYHTAWANYFDDIGPSPFRPNILWIAEQGITTGCGAGRFCPNANVPRDQMASFLSRALGLSGAAPNAFTDDAGNPHEPNINLVAREGIASGCGVGLYCPSSNVARDQMASFLSRALDLSGAATDAFTDDEGNQHEPNINLVAREGIASGCGATTYCPTNLVTRGQMAAFLHRAFD